MVFTRSLLVPALALALPLGARANSLTVQSSAASTFSPISGVSINRNGAPFWDQPSLDGGDRNAGYFLTGTGGVFGSRPAIVDDYFHNGANSFTGFSFRDGGTRTIGVFLLEIAGRRGINSAGWYEVGNPANRRTFIAGQDSPSPDPIVFDTPAHFGIFLVTSKNQEFRSEDPGQFALFRDSGSGTFFVAIEDLVRSAGEGGVGDFNDVIFSLTRPDAQNPIPEPGTFGLMSLVLMGVAVMALRRSRS